nr:GGDEF domain-containing protein [Treponemataceae bacterium]
LKRNIIFAMYYDRKIFIITLCLFGSILLALVFGQIGVKAHNKVEADKNEVIINEVFSTLTYTETATERELDTITNLKDLPCLSDAQLGRINLKLSLLYFLHSDFPEYFKITGEALYYAEKAKDYDSLMNIYLNMAKYFFQINSINRACETVEIALNVQKIENIKNPSVKCFAYQLYTEYFLAKKQYESAMKYNKLFTAAIKDLTDVNEIEMYNRTSNAQKAIILFESGNKSAAYILANQLEKDPVLITRLENQFVVYDFAMPVYYIKAFQSLDRYDFKKALDYNSKYADFCDTYNFTLKKTSLAQKLITLLPAVTYADDINKIAYDIAVNHEKLASYYINNYTDTLYEKLNYACDSLKTTKEKMNRTKNILIQVSMTSLIIIIAILIFALILNEYKTDGLTGLRNRKSLDVRLATLDRRKKPYSIIMLDIDNFKNLNDTYTHAFGDQVLKGISKCILRYEGNKIKSYRYGGEEIVIVITKLELQKIIHIAESLRTEIASLKWSEDVQVTASFGIGTGTNRVVEIADRNMYNSKQKGKNFTTYEIDGSKFLAERRIDIRSADMEEIEAKAKKFTDDV